MIVLLTNIGVIAGAIIGIGVIWRLLIKPLYKLIRKMEQVHAIILEFPDWKHKVDEGLRELHPNGGGSIKDTVNATQTEIVEIRQLVEDHLKDPNAHGS